MVTDKNTLAVPAQPGEVTGQQSALPVTLACMPDR